LVVENLLSLVYIKLKLCREAKSVICGITNKTKNNVIENDSAISDNKLKKDNKIKEIMFNNQNKLATQFIVSKKCIVIYDQVIEILYLLPTSSSKTWYIRTIQLVT